MFKEKLRKEKSVQFSGNINLNVIPNLKERHYYVVNIPLDGDAPKQYIKAHFYYKNCPKINKPSKWHGFYTKFGGKSYPHESITEFTINKIGEYLGLKMNDTKLVIINGQIRFLSKDFIKKRQILIHGVEILVEYYEDKNFVEQINKDRKNRRQFLTFEEIERSIRYVYPEKSEEILCDLVRLISFDAIVGNNDRHFYNWGVIDYVDSPKSNVVFSPIYDSARALLWNKTEESIIQMYNQHCNGSKDIDFYIKRAKPRFSFEENTDANHFELIEYLVKHNSQYEKIVEKLISIEMENHVINRLSREIICFFSKERYFLIEAILKKRFKKLREVSQ